VFYVSTNTVYVILETVLQVKRANQQYFKVLKGKATKKNPEKAKNEIHA